MTNKELIYESLKKVEEQLHMESSIQEMAEDLGFSFFYFSRLFKAITGFGPKNYVTHRKITESTKLLLETDMKVIDIALEFGYGSSESYSRACSKIMDKNPSQIRKEAYVDPLKCLNPLTKDSLEHKTYKLFREPEVVQKKAIYLIGIPFYYDLSMKNDLSDPWNTLMSNLDYIQNTLLPEKFYQLQYWFPNQDGDTIYFYIAVEVDAVKEVPIQLTAKVIPAQTYLKFYHKGLANKVGELYQYIYEEWLPSTSYKLPHLYNFEYYGDEHLGPYDEASISEIYIPIELQE